MRIIALLSLMCVVFFSCEEDDCVILAEPSIAGAFVLEALSTIEWEGDLLKLDVVNATTSYILTEDEAGDFIHLLKSTNGGLNWETIDVPGDYRSKDMLFINDNVGVISYFNSNPSILRTTDGGQTWEDIVSTDLEGRLYDLAKDEAGNLYGIVTKLGTDFKIVKSTDQGQNWQVLRSYPNLGTNGMWVIGDQLFIAPDYRSILVTDLEGQNSFLVELNTSIGNLLDAHVMDQDNIIMTGIIKSVKTTDGGQTWTEIHNNSSWVIDFDKSGKGLMVLNKGYCGDNPIEHGVLGHTENGAATWIEGQNTEYLMDRYVGSEKVGEEEYRVLIGNTFFKISK